MNNTKTRAQIVVAVLATAIVIALFTIGSTRNFAATGLDGVRTFDCQPLSAVLTETANDVPDPTGLAEILNEMSNNGAYDAFSDGLAAYERSEGAQQMIGTCEMERQTHVALIAITLGLAAIVIMIIGFSPLGNMAPSRTASNADEQSGATPNTTER